MKAEIIIPTCSPVRLGTIALEPLADRFGGVTYHSVQGYWQDDEGYHKHDVGTTAIVYVDDTEAGLSEAREYIRSLARKVCTVFDQTCIFVAFDNEHELIEHELIGKAR